MKLSNCFLFALWMFIRHPGSYLLVRRSCNYPGPHFLWGRNDGNGRVRTVQYVPKRPKKRIIPPLFFDGRIKWGDRKH